MDHKILVVDDNADAASALSELLQLMGNEVRTAANGKDAIDTATAMRPDVIFLDIGLPGMSGYEVARILAARPETKDAVLVALTGYGQPDDRRKSLKAGFAYHLVKPAALEDISEILNSLPDARAGIAQLGQNASSYIPTGSQHGF